MTRRAWAIIGLALAGCQATRVEDDGGAAARFYLEAAGSGAEVVLPVSEVGLKIEARPVLTEFDFAGVELAEWELGRGVKFRLTPAASRDLYRLTAANQGRRLVLVIEGEALGARPIEAPIEDGELVVFVEVAESELPLLVQRLQRTATRVREETKR